MGLPIGHVLAIVLLFVFTIFAFVVTNKVAGEALSGKGYKEYRLGDYSNWLQNRVNGSTWERIRRCLQSGKLCSKVENQYVNDNADKFFTENLSALQEMEEGDFFNQSNKNSLDDHELVLGKLLQQSAFSSESESLSPPNNGGSCLSFEDTTTGNNRDKLLTKSNSFNSIASQHVPHKVVTATATATSPTLYGMSFDESTVVAPGGATRELANERKWQGNSRDQSKGAANIAASKKSRNSSESMDHIMAERKRRQELTERFIALSATLPGLKKIDKASILSEAITYVKQLQKRVKDLEEQRCCKKIRVESVSFINKASLYSDEGSVSSGKTNSDDSHEFNVALPEVEARVLEKEVLIRIHCKNQNGSMLKILTHLRSLDLSTISNSVLPFGNSVLDITIIAQMGDKYNLTVKELVKSLRLAILESRDVHH